MPPRPIIWCIALTQILDLVDPVLLPDTHLGLDTTVCQVSLKLKDKRVIAQTQIYMEWTHHCDPDIWPSDLVLLHDTPLGQDTSAYIETKSNILKNYRPDTILHWKVTVTQIFDLVTYFCFMTQPWVKIQVHTMFDETISNTKGITARTGFYMHVNVTQILDLVTCFVRWHTLRSRYKCTQSFMTLKTNLKRINYRMETKFYWIGHCDPDTWPSDLVLLHDTPLGYDTCVCEVSWIKSKV